MAYHIDLSIAVEIDSASDRAARAKQDKLLNWLANNGYSYICEKDSGFDFDSEEDEQHDPHDLLCDTCGLQLNNQCLDPDCEQDNPHRNGDAYCLEHTPVTGDNLSDH